MKENIKRCGASVLKSSSNFFASIVQRVLEHDYDFDAIQFSFQFRPTLQDVIVENANPPVVPSIFEAPVPEQDNFMGVDAFDGEFDEVNQNPPIAEVPEQDNFMDFDAFDGEFDEVNQNPPIAEVPANAMVDGGPIEDPNVEEVFVPGNEIEFQNNRL
uniref:Uncharacterized protein n=1 Tax=Panagrolaimus sp. JU765 TaxID=591449 RepID=A0AC34PX76_9BILA